LSFLSKHLRLSDLFRIWHPLRGLYPHLLLLFFFLTPIRKIARKTRFPRELDSIQFDLPVSTSSRSRDMLNNVDPNGEKAGNGRMTSASYRGERRCEYRSCRPRDRLGFEVTGTEPATLTLDLVNSFDYTSRRLSAIVYVSVVFRSDTWIRPCVPPRGSTCWKTMLNWCFCFARVRLHQLEHSRRRKWKVVLRPQSLLRHSNGWLFWLILQRDVRFR